MLRLKLTHPVKRGPRCTSSIHRRSHDFFLCISAIQRQPSWWRHQMETFSALLAICAGISPAPGDFPAQRPVTRSFGVSLICARINGWVNNRVVVDVRCYRAHYDVIVMFIVKQVLQLSVRYTKSEGCCHRIAIHYDVHQNHRPHSRLVSEQQPSPGSFHPHRLVYGRQNGYITHTNVTQRYTLTKRDVAKPATRRSKKYAT